MKDIKFKIKYILISSLLVILTGCSSSGFQYFDKKEEFVNNAQYTKVLKIVKDDVVTAMVYITYLNNANKKKWNNGQENFIIGVYNAQNEDNKIVATLSFLEKEKMQLDEENIEYKKVVLEPLSQKLITKADELHENIPFKNNWAEYKLLSYEKVKKNTQLNFMFKDSQNNSVKTSFVKLYQ